MKKIKIEDALAEFYEELTIKGRKPRTVEYYKEFIAPFLDFAHIKNASQLNYDLVRSYTAQLRKQYANPVTVNTNLRAVRAFCYFCGRKNYTLPFVISLVSAPKKIKVPYDTESVHRLILNRDLCPQAIAILLFLSTGIRAQTLCNLRVNDVDFYEQTLLLRELKNNTQAILPLPQYVCKRLKRYIKEYSFAENAFLFTKKNGEPHNPHSLYSVLMNYLKKLGIPGKGLHRFRHTFAKLMAEQGISSILLSHWLTHSSIEQSEQYVNLYGTDLRNSLQYNPVEVALQKKKDGE